MKIRSLTSERPNAMRWVRAYSAAAILVCVAVISATRGNAAYAAIWVPVGAVCTAVYVVSSLRLGALRMRTVLAATAAAAVLVALGLVAANASTVPVAPSAPTGTSLCALTPSIVGPPMIQCINGDGHLAHDLHAVNFKRQGHQQTWITQYAECKRISKKCTPFPKGSGLNQQWAGATIVTIASRYHKGQCLGTYIKPFFVTATPIQVPCKGAHDQVWVFGGVKGGFLVINVAYTNAIYNQCGVVDCHPKHAAAVLWIPGTADLSNEVVFWITAKVGLRGHVCTHGITGFGSCSINYKS